MKPVYQRVLIKLSGEALAGDSGYGLDRETLDRVATDVGRIVDLGVEVALVVGGGNFWRGRYGEGMNPAAADSMGMLATVINALALQDVLNSQDVPTRVQSAITMETICEPVKLGSADLDLKAGRVVIFAGGTGNPFFTTDMAAALRAIEIGADILLLAKNVDAVYAADPKLVEDAERFDELTFDDVLRLDLKVMDLTAITLCRERQMPIQVFGLKDSENLLRAVSGENTGTIIK